MEVEAKISYQELKNAIVRDYQLKMLKEAIDNLEYEDATRWLKNAKKGGNAIMYESEIRVSDIRQLFGWDKCVAAERIKTQIRELAASHKEEVDND